MKFQAEAGEETLSVEVRREGDKVIARVHDREYELETSEPEVGVFLFKNSGRIAEAFVSRGELPGGLRQVQIGENTFDIRLVDPKRLRGSQSAAAQGEGAAEIRAAMPGKIVRVLLEGGAEVAKGDGVLVVEAMKMQNEMKAPKAGRLTLIKVKEGSTVAAGEVLAVIE